MGCSTLYHLTQAGVSDAILLERNQLTSGTTWHSAAQVRALRSTRNLTDLIRYSIDLYGRLEAETGQKTGWINKGSLSIATNPERLTHIRRQESLANLFGVEATSVSKEEALERWPLMNAEDVLGAVWSPDDGRVSPSDLCAALVKGAKAKGARIFEQTGVTGILTEADRIIGVETEKGTIKCDAIALCTGLWSREAAGMAGSQIPIWPCEHFYLLTKPIPGISGNMPTLSDHDAHLYIRDDSGGLLVGCFEPLGKAIDPDRLGADFAFQLLPEDWDHFEPMMINALHRLPALETAEVKMLLNGPESFTPDGSFLLGETAETRGLFLGCGMNSVGVATGGGAGMALAHCILHGHTPTDLHEADPKRFPAEFNSVAALSARVPEVLGKHYEITFPGRQWSSARGLKQSPLHGRYADAKAYFGQVYGIERPLYCGAPAPPNLTFGKPDWHDFVRLEVAAATNGAALFDQSSFGKIEVSGPDAVSFLNRVCANQMDRSVGAAVYTAMLNNRGGIESDLTAIRLSETHFRLYVGTAARKRDLAWLVRAVQPGETVDIIDKTDDFAIIGLMGKEAPMIAQAVGAGDLNHVGYFRSKELVLADTKVRAARLSYVGEAGWELTVPIEGAERVFYALQEAGATPAGVFAQTSMRIEKGFCAYGHELDTDISPLEAGLEFAVAWNKADFVGKAALGQRKQCGPGEKIMTLLFEDDQAVPIGNEPIVIGSGIVGKTTSAAFGFRVGAPVALALISCGIADGTSVMVDIAGKAFAAVATTGPAYDPMGMRMRAPLTQALEDA